MIISSMTDIARMVARILARRQTPLDEVPDLIDQVHLALGALTEPEIEAIADPLEESAPRTERRPRRQRLQAPMPVEEPAAPPPPPKLVRRAEVVNTAPAPNLAFAAPTGAVRGVVKWFDLRTHRGVLQLPGFSGDVPVEPSFLAEMGITRLYKGQEVEATVEAGASPRILRLSLPGGAWSVTPTGGVVRSRRAKPVVVELKREALRRVAARAEAELLLRPNRAR